MCFQSQLDVVEGSLDVVFYGAIIAILLMIIALVVKLLWDHDSSEAGEHVTTANENSRLLLSAERISFSFYGSSSDEDLESGKMTCNSSSSDDLYDEKICAICYDDQRSCLFVPCGHCITCYNCAKRSGCKNFDKGGHKKNDVKLEEGKKKFKELLSNEFHPMDYKIVDDEIKTCPICRTFIHKVRRLQIL